MKHHLLQSKTLTATLIFGLLLASPATAHAMHVMEGFIPLGWCLLWGALSIPFIALGVRKIILLTNGNLRITMLLALSGAFAFALSALKIPSITGSCSHPTGMGLGAVMFGPFATSVLGFIVLLFQALLLAHGGLSTLGANAFSMAIVGPIVSYLTFVLLAKKIRCSAKIAVFFAATLGSLCTYVVTSAQLAAAFPAADGGFWVSFGRFAGIFALTQVPISVIEGLISTLVFAAIMEKNGEELTALNVLPEDIVFEGEETAA